MTQETLINLASPDFYFNRELSWLDFNRRVILEARDSHNPLLERINFLAIGSSNLDEFFMVRVAGLQDQLKFGFDQPDSKTLMTSDQQLNAISEKNRKNVALQYDSYESLREEACQYQLQFVSIEDLTEDEYTEVNHYYYESLLPILTPLRIDAYHPFPHLNNKMLHLFVRLKQGKNGQNAVIPIPTLTSRYYVIQNGDQRKFVFLEDIIANYLYTLFPGIEIVDYFVFRITRNADLDINEDGAEDLLLVIEDFLKQRKNGSAVRLEVDHRHAKTDVSESIQFLMDELELKQRDYYSINGPLDLTFIFQISSMLKADFPELAYQPFQPTIPTELKDNDLFEVIEKQDVFLHHPYDSFDPVVAFINEAADDKDTWAIKQTLYRVSKDSPIVGALKRAAENGIQVTVLVELKARFDEENNLHWAKELEESGANVLYGMSDLKTHSKIALVVKKKNGKMIRYVHLGTGNYNDQTAKLYEDMGIMTTNQEIGEDATLFFNYLSGYSETPVYKHLYVSPDRIRLSFFDYIEKEIALHKKYQSGRIIAKMNSLTDKKIIMKLYEASQAGVQIDLIIRGICCLRAGIPGVSENIRVRSIVGRFLEHSRIYYFHQNGKRHLFLSSADMMTRNMVDRVEIEFPVLDEAIKDEILSIIDYYLADNVKARELLADGKYDYIRNDQEQIVAQDYFMLLSQPKEAIIEPLEKPLDTLVETAADSSIPVQTFLPLLILASFLLGVILAQVIDLIPLIIATFLAVLITILVISLKKRPFS